MTRNVCRKLEIDLVIPGWKTSPESMVGHFWCWSDQIGHPSSALPPKSSGEIIMFPYVPKKWPNQLGFGTESSGLSRPRQVVDGGQGIFVHVPQPRAKIREIALEIEGHWAWNSRKWGEFGHANVFPHFITFPFVETTTKLIHWQNYWNSLRFHKKRR